jgi:hypothetical protein
VSNCDGAIVSACCFACLTLITKISLIRVISGKVFRESYCGVGEGEGLVLSSTLFAPFLVACAPLWTVFLVPFLILCPVFLAARAVE